jgi:hypothetical protein
VAGMNGVMAMTPETTQEKPMGGDSYPDPGFHIVLKSMLSIKTGSTVSHDVTTRVNAAIKVRCPFNVKMT